MTISGGRSVFAATDVNAVNRTRMQTNRNLKSPRIAVMHSTVVGIQNVGYPDVGWQRAAGARLCRRPAPSLPSHQAASDFFIGFRLLTTDY
jgi:hypothetical protein